MRPKHQADCPVVPNETTAAIVCTKPPMWACDIVLNNTPRDGSFAGAADATRGTSIAKEVETAARQWLRIKEPEYCRDDEIL